MLKYILNQLRKNIQVSQTLLLITIVIIGIEFYGLNLNYLKLAVIFGSVIFLDMIFTYLRTGKHIFPYSGVNAGFGITFFLRTEILLIYFFAALLAIGGKNLIRVDGRHFFNPSNMGVFLTLILFPNITWTNSLQWSNYIGGISLKYIIIHVIVLLFGVFITYRVYKFFKFRYFLDYTLPFVLLHIFLFYLLQHNTTISTTLLFFSISFLIFTFHMISDPKTVPESSQTRFFYAINLVLAFYVLQFHINEAYAMLGSLFVNTLFLPLIWKLEHYYIKNVKLNYASVFSLILGGILIVYIYSHINIYGRIDLLFDNLCHQLICK